MPSILDASPIRILVNGQNVTQTVDEGLSWGNSDPGGFSSCSIPIARDCPEIQVGQPIQIQSGLQTAWEGRVGQIQRSLGNKTEITGQGYGAVLSDYEMSMVYVDRDLTRLQQPSVNQQINIVQGNQQEQSFQVGADPKNQSQPALVQLIGNSWSSPWTPNVQSWYDAGPQNLVAQVYYNLSFSNSVATTVGNWSAGVHISADDQQGSDEATGNLYSGPNSTPSGYFNPATAHRFAMLQFQNTQTGNGAQGAAYNAYWTNPAFYGNHGLTGVGADPVGFYPSDIAVHALTQLPAGLIVPGIIPQYTAYTVPHYVQYVPVPIEQIISDMAGLAGVHYGVWESLAPLTGAQTPRLDFRPYPSTPTCWCFRSDCDALDINQDLSGYYDTAQVTYTDVAGIQQCVQVTLDNPLLDAVGLHRTLQIDCGTGTKDIAKNFGLMILQLSQLQCTAAGSATFSGMVQTTGGTIPAWMLRSGIDRLRIIDLPGQSAFGSFQDFIVTSVETSIGSSGIQTQVQLSAGANLVQVLQARLAQASPLSGVF